MSGGAGLQDVLALLVVAAAAGWLVARRFRRRASGPACPDCPVAATHPGIRRPPMPVIKPTAEGAARLATRRTPLVQITGLKPGPGR